MQSTTSIFFFCRVLTLAVCCDWLTHYSHLRNSSMVLIEVMGGPLTNQTSPVEFPYNLYKRMMNRQVKSQLLFIRDSMTQIYDLYRYNDMSLAAWDSVKTTDFLESIHRQIRELDECVKPTRKSPNKLQLRIYYNNLKNQTLLVSIKILLTYYRLLQRFL
uniref:Uncharacterized protein n=1 Tax=Cyprinodon variegatus TaxID=28743 RepID=A0A3Q2FDC7_CYPVA